MIGVVVWSNRARQQAVIWCEDHAALAYLAGAEHCVEQEAWPEPGDMVELEAEDVGELRCARRVRLLKDERLPLLPELLRRGRGGSGSAPRLMVVSNSAAPVALAAEKSARMPRRQTLGVAAG